MSSAFFAIVCHIGSAIGRQYSLKVKNPAANLAYSHIYRQFGYSIHAIIIAVHCNRVAVAL